MGLLDWLKGKNSPVLPDPPCERADLDWAALEQELVDAFTVEIADFALLHQDEIFYSVALDCNACYANVLLCENTFLALKEVVSHYIGEDFPNINEESLRWGFGDWKYQGFNLDSEAWQTHLAPRLEEFAELPHPEDTEQFLVTCCRALLRVERDGGLRCLQVTSDFKVTCMDHDENFAQGESRLDRVRAAL